MSNPIVRAWQAFVALATGGLTKRVEAAKKEAERIVREAEEAQRQLQKETREEAQKTRAAAEAEYKDRRGEAQRMERRLAQKEDSLDKKLEGIERRERGLKTKEQQLETLQAEIEQVKQKEIEELERVAGLSKEDALAHLFKSVENELEHEASKRIYEIEQRIRDDADMKGRKAIALAIQRLTSDVVSETTVSVVPLPSDDMKGRLIGREGRNIRALEQATGVDLIIDDTPEVVTISGYDPVRREIARLAISKLMLDGRIHPARIEDMVNKAKQEVEDSIKKAGDEAIIESGVLGLNREVVLLLGRLKYRYSYGQNVLKHSIEVAHIAGMMASEIGANVQVCKAGGLLHDLGKALSHEIEGGHAEIGGEIARKYGVNPAVAAAIEEHHEEDRVNVEAFLVAAADAISGGRPGARRDTVHLYVKRLQELEECANSFEGVEKSFAIQAGREVRIMVKPDQVDDMAAAKLAYDISKKVQETLIYPGQIKITVIRETRNVGYAK
ncbi:MAG: 2,3 cyclic-nucleotide 2-phosphodiesterase [Dehalococcoidia bacterium]|nr:2,3 cyclic-nucleotide 2-phosphodiesterase [Dehalococcoidia bacterium]